MNFMYVFGYQNKFQFSAPIERGGDDEDSAAVVITAESAEAALEWGGIISEAFLKWLHNGEDLSWEAMRFASYVEMLEAEVANLPKVAIGEMPDFLSLLPQSAVASRMPESDGR